MNEFKFLGEGWTRVVFLTPSGKYVVKIPKDFDGAMDNLREYRLSKCDGLLLKNQKARCRLLGVILVMEYVDTDKRFEVFLPDWVKSVDCAQVGVNRKGRLVAYDFA